MPQHDTESPPHFTLTTNNDLSPQTIHLENSEPLSTQGITAANSDHANGLTVAASGGPNHTSDNVHGTTDDDATLFGAPDDVFPAQWGVVRGLAPARRVERSWVDPVSEPAGGGAHARRFEVRSGFDVRKFEVGGQSVSDVTVRVRLVGGGQSPAVVDALWDRAVGGVERVFNRPGAVLPDGSVLHVTLERVTGNASDAHLNVNVGGPRGAMDQYEWSIDATELDLAHELGHQLGLRDEYQETSAEHRPEVDGSLMGNYHNTAPDGLPQGGLRDRYLQLIHAQIGSHDDRPVGDHDESHRATDIFTGIAPRLKSAEQIIDRIVGKGDGAAGRPYRYLGGFPFSAASRKGPSNIISHPVVFAISHGDVTANFALHLNVTLRSTNETRVVRRGNIPEPAQSTVSIRGDYFHLTVRSLAVQQRINAGGAAQNTAEYSIHTGPGNSTNQVNNREGWNTRPENTQALAVSTGIPAAMIIATLDRKYPKSWVLATLAAFKNDIIRQVVAAGDAQQVHVQMSGDSSFMPERIGQSSHALVRAAGPSQRESEGGFRGFFRQEAARRGMTLSELETRMYAPVSVLIRVGMDRPMAVVSSVYRELAAQGIPGVHGETSKQLFAITSASTAREVKGLGGLFGELARPEDANLRVTTAGHSFFVEKRAGLVQLLQSYVAKFSLVNDFERGVRLSAVEFAGKLQDIVSAYRGELDAGRPVGNSFVHRAEVELFGGKLFASNDFASGEGQGLDRTLVVEVATDLRDADGQRQALDDLLHMNVYGVELADAWNAVQRSDETLHQWMLQNLGWSTLEEVVEESNPTINGDGMPTSKSEAVGGFGVVDAALGGYTVPRNVAPRALVNAAQADATTADMVTENDHHGGVSLGLSAEWGVVRGLAPARRVERSWVDPVSEPAGGGAHARRFEVRSGFDVRKFEVGGQSVSDVTVRVRLVGGGQSPAVVDALWDRAVGGVERVFNRPGAVLPDGSVLHVTLERVTGNASDAHLNVNVGGPRGAMDQYEWSIDATELDLAHELGHQLGLRDEYQETSAEHRPEVDGSLMGNYHNTAPDGLPQGGLRDRYLQLIHAQIGSHDDRPVGDVVRAGSEGDMTSRGLAPHAPGEERQGRQIDESDLTDRMRRWLDRPATMNRFVQVKHLAGLRYTGQPNWTPETLVSIGSLNLDYADRARLILRVPGLNDELAAALHKRLDDVESAPPRVLVQPGYASGDQFSIAAALIVDPYLHVVLVSDVGGKPDSSGAVADFYRRSGISPSRVHRITANKGQSAQEASRKTVNSLLDVISPGLSSNQKLERTLGVREGTKWVARNFTVGVRRTLRRTWEVDDVGFPPRVQEYVRTWLTVQQAVPSTQQDTIVLWSRFSGKRGYAHPEHDTSFEGMRQILRKLAERAKERGERPLVVIAGDAYSDPKHARKYEDIAEKARKDGLNVRNLTNFWKGGKTSLRAWGGDNRVGQFRLYEYLNRHSRSVRHLGYRSGNLEAMALIGHTVMYLEERGAPSAWRMEQWHAAENSLRTRDRALAVGYERILIEEPPTRTGKVITRSRETAARMAPNDPARNHLPDFKNPPWIFGALHRQPKPAKFFKETDKGFYQDDLQKIADYLLPRQVPAAPAPPGRAAVRAPRLENVPVRPDGPDQLDGGGLAMQAAMWAEAAQQRAADVQRWAAERTGAQRDAANAAQQAARARQEAADNRRKAKGWEENLRQAQAKEREAEQQAKTAEEMAAGWQRAAQAGRATELQALHQQALARQQILAARQAQRAAQHQAVVAAQYQWLAEQRAAVEDQVLQRALAEQRTAEQRAAEAQKEEQRALAEQRAAEAQRDEKRAAEKRAAEKKPAEKKPAEKKPAEKKPAEKKPAEKKPAEKKPAPRRKPTYRDGDFSDTDEVENLVPDDRSFFGDMENEVPAEHIQWALAQHPGRRTTAEPQPVVGFGKSRFGLRTDKLPVSRSERFRTLRYRTDTEPLYRYDTRHYDTIFNEGFHPWNGKRVRSLAHYQSYVQRTAMVSASRSGGEYLPEWAAAADGTAYLYVIHAPGGIDMVESLQRRARYPMQEVVFWKGIRPEFIDRVELVRKPPNQRYPEVLRVISRGDWENEFETGGRTLQDGSWRGPSGLKLTVDANRLASDLAVRSYQLEPRITLQVQSCTKNVKHLKFSSDVKTAASLKRKLAKQLLENPGVAAQDAVNGFGDAVRYTVTVTRFDKYAKRVGEIAEELRSHDYTLIYHRNSWGSPGYQGINTVWHDRKNRINFEIQFHTVRSREAREAAHIFYEKMRIPGLDQAKQKEYAEEMHKIFHTIPLPEGVFTIEGMASGGEGA
ncbi:scabin-related ADP-ribosyltransferase [Actinacidiphila glaucinigra]|uniref:scabin-related ADP-ribosyltransferase n=1 Tax=Actinacidiphila glaucinigra TaxID=235986 RepID=UPI0035E1928F